MSKWNKTAGILFWAAASVYPVGTLLAGQANSGKNSGQEVRLLEETAGPGAAGDNKDAKGGDKPTRTAGPVPVILITYATTEDAVRKALAAVRRDKVIHGAPQVIRIEKN